MKTFKKLALVSAIAAAPFAQAEMVAIDDALMGEMTGQAGITIELSTEVKIGDVIYTDTDGLDNGAGSLAISGIRLGGATAGTALDNIKIDIDVDDTDGLVIHLGATNLSDVLTGNTAITGSTNAFGEVLTEDGKAVDFGLDVNSVSLNNGANLVSDVHIEGFLGPIDVKIANNGDIDVAAYFEVTNGSLDVDVLGLGITNLTVGQDSSPILTDAEYAADIANFQDYVTTDKYAVQVGGMQAQNVALAQDGTGNGYVAANAANITAAGQNAYDVEYDAQAVTLGYADGAAMDLAADAGHMATADTAAEATRAPTEAGATTSYYDAGVASVVVADVEAATLAGVKAQVVGGVSNMAYVGMQITSGAAGYRELNGTDLATWSADDVLVSNSLIIDITAMSMDISMDLTMGSAVNQTTLAAVSTDLGSVVINDLDLSGTQLKIYGH
jgi:hypothetical protein